MKTGQTKRNDNWIMRATIALFIVGLLSACLVGCATPGRCYDDGKVAMINKDVTTEAELVDWFGPPITRSMAPDGSKTMAWKFSQGKDHPGRSAGSLEVRLGSDGKVTAYSASAGSK
jgi:hypothetical protein